MLLAGRCVLVVEDDMIIGEWIADAIREAGGQIAGPYDTMVDALEQLGNLGAIGGAVLDVGLGHEPSYPLADALQTTRIPFIFLTGLAKSELPERFQATPYLRKPFTAPALVQALIDSGIAST